MVSTVCTFRYDEEKRKRLEQLAVNKNLGVSQLIRERMDDYLDYQNAAERLAQSLREKFTYIKTAQGLIESKRERKLRNMIADELEKAFGIGGR